MPLPPPPEAGQLVEVRRRRWVVKNVSRSETPPDPLRSALKGPQNLVELSSVEEDGLGDELRVIWEIEPGARVFENALLPDPRQGFDEPRRFDAFLDAVRWGAVASADVRELQSPFRSGIEIEDYQLDPVVRAVQMPRVNLLIADDVGIGKTIEAGLVAQELILRQRVRSILIVCPASLLIKWRDEMRQKFGLEFRIVDSDMMRDLRRRRGIWVNPWTHYRYLITSIDWLKRDKPLRLFREVLPAYGQRTWPRTFDLLICDEAHNFAPSGSGKYAIDSDRTLAIRTITPHFEHKLFLSATPHNGYRESFSALLELLDDQRFARTVPPDPKQLDAVMVRRMKSEIKDFDGKPRFPERKIVPIEVHWSAQERDAFAKLRRYGELRLASSAGDPSVRLATEFVLKLLKKRLFSSPAAFAQTLEKHMKTLRGIRDASPRRRTPAPGILRRELDRSDDDWSDDDNWEIGSEEAVDTATSLFDRLTDEERALLRDLRDWADRAKARPDSKCERLIEWLDSELKTDGDWNDQRVIIFTEYRATQKWLHNLLAVHGFASDERLLTLWGGMDSEERERAKAAFQEHPARSAVRILLATDAAAEGIDLQNWCWRIVHQEIPWNPNRLEQRNGRVDRHGQKRDPLIHHFVGEGWDATREDFVGRGSDLDADLEFLWVAANKVEQMREDLRGKVGLVLARQVEEAMLGRRRRIDTAEAERTAEVVRRQLTFERDLRSRISELRDRLQDSRRELDISAETVRRVVEEGLALANRPPLRETNLEGIWPDPAGRRRACPVFRLPTLGGSWDQCALGLEHPFTKEIRPITFDHDLIADDRVVLVHLHHPLAQMCQRLLRAQVWSAEEGLIHRVSARLVPDEASQDPVVVAHARLVVLGALDQRLHEEIIVSAGRLRDGRFARLNVGETRAVLAAATDRQPSRVMEIRLQELWPKIEPAFREALAARARERTAGLEKRLQERAEQDERNVRAVLGELERSIRREIDTPEPSQLELPLSEERDQFTRNRDALRARLEEIPADLEREVATIRGRYRDPVPRHFPVAITFLVPERLER